MAEYFIYLFAAAVIVFPWFIVSKTFERLPKKQEKAKEKAIKLGHVVTASFVRSFGKSREDGSRESQCEYQYYCKGKKYKYTLFTDFPPREIDLYYIRNPRKAEVAGAINVSEKPWLLRYVIVAAIIILVMKLIVK